MDGLHVEGLLLTLLLGLYLYLLILLYYFFISMPQGLKQHRIIANYCRFDVQVIINIIVTIVIIGGYNNADRMNSN